MIGKTRLIATVRARLPELDAGRGAAVVDSIFAAITDLLAGREPVSVPGLGTFSLARSAVPDPAECMICFRPSPLGLLEHGDDRRYESANHLDSPTLNFDFEPYRLPAPSRGPDEYV